MRLIQCQATNFMGFSQLTLELDHPMVVLLADNGVGKSSALKAMRVALGGWMLGVPGATPVAIAPWMMRQQLQRVGYDLTEESTGTTTVSATARLTPQGPLSPTVSWTRARKEGKQSRTDRKSANAIREHAQSRLESTQQPLPLLAYYGARRRVPSRITPRSSLPQSRQKGYDGALESSIDYSERFGRWQRLRNQALENKAAKPVYDALLSALTNLLPGVSRVEFNSDYGEPVVSFTSDTAGGGLRKFSALSDGYQNVLGLGLDIALRAIQLNPQLNGNVLNQTVGVVLIDEADQHLHPTWQAELPASLRAAFPRMQFILATHSPLVAMGAAPIAQIIRLRATDQGATAIELSASDLGSTVGTTLRSPAFGLATTWSPAVLELVRARTALLSLKHCDPEREGLSEQLSENTAALERHRGGPITHTEDLLRVVLKDLVADVTELTPERAEALRSQLATRIRARSKR